MVGQHTLPMVEILTLAKRGAGELVWEAGLRMILLAIAQEAEALTGGASLPGPARGRDRLKVRRSGTRQQARRGLIPVEAKGAQEAQNHVMFLENFLRRAAAYSAQLASNCTCAHLCEFSIKFRSGVG